MMSDPAPSAPIIRLEGVSKRFGPLTAVDALSLETMPQEMLGLIGPDGAGKTTTMRLILGLIRPDAGRIETCGLDPARQRFALSGRVGYLSQRFSLYGDLSCDENVAFFAEVHGVRSWKPRRDALLEMFRLAPFRTRLAERLSGGMKQKLALACTLIHTPELLVLDEPTTGVDPVSRREFWKILTGLQRDGLTIVLTTPYLDEAERCGRVALLDHGRLLTLDRPSALRESAVSVLCELIARPKPAAAAWLRARPEVQEVETFGERLHVTMRSTSTQAVERLREGLRSAGFEVESARAILPSLEDIYIARIRSIRADAPSEVLK
jgi:ABC-2 type transport system ATP-binding protein